MNGPSFAQLSTAITSLSSSRNALLTSVEEIQAAASALDATDLICAKGHGISARDAYRKAEPQKLRADASMRNLPSSIANYRAALAALGSASSVVTGPKRTALGAVVRDGQAEATAVADFHAKTGAAWKQYDALDKLQALWLYRALTPWYRTDAEAAAAYDVLASPFRRFVNAGRKQLGQASVGLQSSTSAQSAALRAADAAINLPS